MAAQQARANLQYQSSMANYNATVAENNALAAKYAADNEAEVFEDRFRRLQASQGPKYAAAGVLINQDTPLAVAIDTAEQGYLEKAAILYSGDVKSAAAREAAKVQRYTAATYAGMEKPTMVAGGMGAGTSLLGGLGGALVG
jgi:hypothetical protein